MGRMRIAGGSMALAVLVAAGAAQADVTAKQVWDNWKATAEASGQTITSGSEEQSGKTLTVRNVTVSAKSEEGTMTGTLSELDFTEKGDGTVEVTMAPDYPIKLDLHPKGGKPTQLTLVVSQTGMTVNVSGSPGDMTYDIAAPDLAVTLDSLKTDGEDVDLNFMAALSQLKGTYVVKGSGDRSIASSGTAGGLTLTASGKNPDTEGSFSVKANMANLTVTSNAKLKDGVDMQNMDAALKAGVSMDAAFGYGKLDYSFDGEDGGKATHGEGANTDGKLSFAIDKSRLHYGASSATSSMTMSGGTLPIPVSVGMAASAFDLVVPVMKSDAAQDFSVLFKMTGLTLNDEVWAMFDPTKVLPRDPATLAVDLAGKVKLTSDIFDPKAEASGKPPGQVEEVKIKELHLAALGADLAGTGAFTFDNSDLATFKGMPRPEGAIELTLKGAMGLMDNLVKMGLIPEDQAAGSKMMLGLFAKPGDGPDTMVSKIEVTKEGHVMANGQRLK